MSFNGNFTAVQSTDISGFTLTDTSTGADGGLTDRQVFIYKTDGTLLTGAVIDWPIANNTLVLTGILPIDYALSIVVFWVSSAPLAPPSTYTQTVITGFTGNTINFILGLIGQIAAKQDTTNDQGFLYNLGVIQTYVDNVALCVAKNDQGNAQVYLSLAQGMIQNQDLYF
jgi:hypothetical protein